MPETVSYTFLTRLGKGGFGEVYLAEQAHPGGLRRQVAVKLLKADIGNQSEAVKRLLDEGHMLSMLRHPCIVGVHEIARVDGRLALITEYVEGIDVSKHCKRGNLLPERVVWEIVAEVASALDCAWNTRSGDTGKPLQLIHRDIKPENIRLGRHGEVKLLDFGIARSTEVVRQAETAAGQLPFTPGYVPPEVFLRGEVNGTTDIYALACTMYRLLSGEKLYQGMDLAQTVQLAVLRDEYERWLETRLQAPGFERAGSILRWMLHYTPEGRPTAAQAAQACEEMADQVPGPTRRRWARGQTFVHPSVTEGALAGRTVNEPTLSIASPMDSISGGIPGLPDDPTLPRPPEQFTEGARRQATAPYPGKDDATDEEVDDDATAADDSLQAELGGGGLMAGGFLAPAGEDDDEEDADAPTVIDQRGAFLRELEEEAKEQAQAEAKRPAAHAPLPEPTPVTPSLPPSDPGRPRSMWISAVVVVVLGVAVLAGLYVMYG